MKSFYTDAVFAGGVNSSKDNLSDYLSFRLWILSPSPSLRSGEQRRPLSELEWGGCSAVFVLQQPPGFSPSRRVIMDPRSSGVAGILVWVALVLSSSLRAGGEGERSLACQNLEFKSLSVDIDLNRI